MAIELVQDSVNKATVLPFMRSLRSDKSRENVHGGGPGHTQGLQPISVPEDPAFVHKLRSLVHMLEDSSFECPRFCTCLVKE